MRTYTHTHTFRRPHRKNFKKTRHAPACSWCMVGLKWYREIYANVYAIIKTHAFCCSMTVILLCLVEFTWSYIYIKWIIITPAFFWCLNHSSRQNLYKRRVYKTSFFQAFEEDFWLHISYYIWPNKLEYLARFTEQNGSNFRFIGEGWQSYTDFFVHNDRLYSMTHQDSR